MDTIEDLSERIEALQHELAGRVDLAPNLRDFPLGGAGYAEAIAAHHAATAAMVADLEALAGRRLALRLARIARSGPPGAP